MRDDARIDAIDFADLTELVPGDLHRARADHPAILAGQPHRATSLQIERRDHRLVDEPAEHHLDDIHGLRVGDANAFDELALLAEPTQLRTTLRAGTRHDRMEARRDGKELVSQ